MHLSEANKSYNDNRRPLYHALYGSLRWKRARIAHLTRAPFCVRCGGFATIAHHKIEPKGDALLFYDTTNLESLCVACHNRVHMRGAPAAAMATGAGKQR